MVSNVMAQGVFNNKKGNAEQMVNTNICEIYTGYDNSPIRLSHLFVLRLLKRKGMNAVIEEK